MLKNQAHYHCSTVIYYDVPLNLTPSPNKGEPSCVNRARYSGSYGTIRFKRVLITKGDNVYTLACQKNIEVEEDLWTKKPKYAAKLRPIQIEGIHVSKLTAAEVRLILLAHCSERYVYLYNRCLLSKLRPKFV